MKYLITTFVALAISHWAWADARPLQHYNLNNGVGFKAHDPVSTLVNEDNIPEVGDMALSYEYEGVTYFFANEDNLERFKEKPSRYEPTYGGWCAYAMAFGNKVDIDPSLNLVTEDRIHYFINSRARRSFLRNVESIEARADQNWEQISGEKAIN